MEDIKESVQSKFLDITSRIYSLSGLPWYLKSIEMKNKESLKEVRVQLPELKEMLDNLMDKLGPDFPEGFKQLLDLIDEEVLHLTDTDIDDWIF